TARDARLTRSAPQLLFPPPASPLAGRLRGDRRAWRLTLCWLWPLWLSCLLVSPVAGQSYTPRRMFGRYQQFVWQDQHGLPQNGISAIAQTRDGYLGLATAEGVVRFDGGRFTTFDSVNTRELRSSNIKSLLADRTGALWVCYGSGLNRYQD